MENMFCAHNYIFLDASQKCILDTNYSVIMKSQKMPIFIELSLKREEETNQ